MAYKCCGNLFSLCLSFVYSCCSGHKKDSIHELTQKMFINVWRSRNVYKGWTYVRLFAIHVDAYCTYEGFARDCTIIYLVMVKYNFSLLFINSLSTIAQYWCINQLCDCFWRIHFVTCCWELPSLVIHCILSLCNIFFASFMIITFPTFFFLIKILYLQPWWIYRKSSNAELHTAWKVPRCYD